MFVIKLQLCTRLLAAFPFLFAALSAVAQDYPSKSIRFIVPNTPGVILDLTARILAPEMSKALGQPLVVENKPGAGQVIGYEFVATQPADGYTIVSALASQLALLPVAFKNLRFNPLTDLPPFIRYAEGRYLLGSSSQLPWKSFNEMIANAKANPGKLNYGSSTPLAQLATEALIRSAGVDIVHVPYSSGAPFFQGLIAGQVQVGFVSESTVVSFGDKFRVLAVTGAQRLSSYPQAPTLTELGFPQIQGITFSLNARAGTPKAVFDKLHAAASRALQQSEIRAQLAKAQLDIIELAPEAAAKALIEEARLFADTAKRIGFKPE